MSENLQILLVILLFWFAVLGLDLLALYSLRRSRIEATAKVLWVVWVIGVPIIGAVSYFIVRPAADLNSGPHSGAPPARG